MSRARITLLQPSDGFVYAWKSEEARRKSKRMPLGLGYIAAPLLDLGHSVKIVDAALYEYSVEEAVEHALANDPHIVGITCTTPLYGEACKIVDLIKKKAPGVVIVMGGPHVSALPRATLETSKTDFVCIGEGEESFPQVVDCVINGKDPAGIIGIAYNWKEQSGETTQYRHRIAQSKDTTAPAIDLNKYPVPSRELFDYNEYYDFSRDRRSPQTNAMFSRGCPGKCAFCGAADTLVRWRHVDNCLDELEHIEKGLGIENVFVMDDTYTSNKKRVLELSRGIVDRGIKLNIGVQLRLDQIDEEICDAMFESGVSHVGPGIESGNADIIKAIGKGPRESKEHMLDKVRLLQNYDWKLRNSYVFGMPGETEEQIMETIEFAKELSADETAFSILVPYPDSPLWAIAKETGKVDDHMDFSRFLYYKTVGCNLSAVSTERLLELHEFAYEYVGSPAYNFDDDAISSGNRPHIPYLASEAFKKHREETKNKPREKEAYSYDAIDVAYEKQTQDKQAN
ncbi:MAG: B12-binding domain-containing radical SAM protein [Rhodospirillaceae bacterium]|nr:B12-binding domain-containing radical SAM protein [Rhodospirillaceae bacterium]